MTARLPLDLEDPDIRLHACADRLLMLAALDHQAYRKVALALLAHEGRLETRHSASDWAYHISGAARKMGVDARFIVAAVLTRLTGLPDILHLLLDIEIKAALDGVEDGGGPDLDQLRRLHATMMAALLRPLLKSAMGAPHQQRRLETDAADMRKALQDWSAHNLAPERQPLTTRTSSADEGRSILLILSWLPADPHKGAHLKQIMSYTHGLMLASQAGGRPPARVRLILTYDDATTWLTQNFQGYSRNSAAIIEEAIKDTLGPELAGNFSVGHFLPQLHETTEAWLRAILADAEAFGPDAVVRWYGFYASNAIAPALHARWPVVGVQFNANNPVDPYADVLLSHGTLDPERAASDPRWRKHQLPLEVLPRRLDMTREEVGLPEAAFTLVSTLSGGRLERSVSFLPKTELAALLALFDTRPNLVWLWVGVQNEDALRNIDPGLAALMDAGRIRCLGFSEDLRALYRHCDLYVHLPRMVGGGMGVAMAVAEEVAVLCHAGSDPCNFLPETTIPGDWTLFYDQLTLLIDKAEARQNIAAEQLDWMNTHHSLPGVGKEVLGFIDDATAARRGAPQQTGERT